VSLNDNATLVINTGNFFTSEVGTAIPTDLLTIPIAWENIGHTSLEDIFSQESEGGDTTILQTLQNKALRTKRTAKTDSFNVTVQQFDKPTLKLYHGSNAIELSDGTLGVPTDPQPTVKAFLAVFYDGENVFALYAPKAEILGTEPMSFADTESLAGLTLKITPVVNGTNKHAYAVTPLGAVDAG